MPALRLKLKRRGEMHLCIIHRLHWEMGSRVLQCVAVCCSVLQCVAVCYGCCSVLQCAAGKSACMILMLHRETISLTICG